jgi:hypothetical protein
MIKGQIEHWASLHFFIAMNHHYNTANYNQCPSYNLIHPLNTTLPMSNNPIPYLMPISSYSSPTQSLSPSFNVDTSSHKPLQSPNVHSTQKRKTINENLEHFSSTSSYSSIISFPEANSPLKKSKSTPIPSREETESSEDEAKLRQRVLERNRLAGKVLRYIFF